MRMVSDSEDDHRAAGGGVDDVDDPLLDLTRDQRIVLYTLFLCLGKYKYSSNVHNEATMGDIDVMKTVIELRRKGLMDLKGDQLQRVTRSYRKKCIVNDMDKDFFTQVASPDSLLSYAEVYLSYTSQSRQLTDTSRIPYMRMMMQDCSENLVYLKVLRYQSGVPTQIKRFKKFTREWCRNRNLDPVAWADGISDEAFLRFSSAYALLSVCGNGIDNSLTTQKWSILFSILMSENYCISVNTSWVEKIRKIQEKFPALSDSRIFTKNEILLLFQELVDIDQLLTSDTQKNTFAFISEDVRHQVMCHFVLNCLKMEGDLKNYIKLSSIDSIFEYVNVRQDSGRTRLCLYIPQRLLISELGINVILNDLNGMRNKSASQSQRKAVSRALRIPCDLFNHDLYTRVRFLKFAKAFVEREQFPHCELSLNSLLGSFFIDENIEKPRDPKTLHMSLKKWSILITILMSTDYSLCLDTNWKDSLEEIRKAFPTLQDDDGIEENDIIIKELLDKDFVLKQDKEKKCVRFLSEDVRHQVISFFFINCLKTHEDYKRYMKQSSTDSLLEYVRPWWYERDSNERCLYLPENLDELFIKRLGIEILIHTVLGKRKEISMFRNMFRKPKGLQEYGNDIVKYLNVPQEILFWGQEARCRYVDCAKKGTQTIHRARAIIVGCAGAGKTTLLKRLQNENLEELKQVQSTVGLEVHEDIFEIEKNSSILKAVTKETNKEERQLLSVMDLGGQCAYYACHQVYLSRRAFYLLVIDMSKDFCQTVDPSVCDQEGTMFADWTYGEYVLFWLKSIHTYCDDDSPIIIVGTHLDNTRGQDSNKLYDNILDHIKDNKHLKNHLRRDRCFVLGFQRNDVTVPDALSEVEKCIVSIVREERWKETIPADWALSEIVLRELRTTKTRMCTVTDLSKKCFGKNEEKYSQIGDILKFYHDIGVVLYFNESTLSETVIIDIQWFVDSFKNIIADPNHVRDVADNNRDWLDFYRTGHILDSLLISIWSSKHFEINLDVWDRNQEKTNLLQYMQRLGLIAVGTDTHYIPCMNKRTFGSEEEKFFESTQCKTSVLVFRFNFLPIFFYF